MTVRELIAQLQRMPLDQLVIVRDDEGDLVEADSVETSLLNYGPWARELVVHVSGS